MGQEVPRVVAVTARVEATMGTDAASSPAVIGHYCVPDWAGNRGVLLFFSIKHGHSQSNPFPHTHPSQELTFWMASVLLIYYNKIKYNVRNSTLMLC